MNWKKGNLFKFLVVVLLLSFGLSCFAMEKHTYDPSQPQGTMSLMNMRNTLRALFQLDFMPLRPRASLLVDDMEYSSDAGAQAEWIGTGVTEGNSIVKQEGSYALELVIDATGNRSVENTINLNLSAFLSVTIWERCTATSSAFKFYIKDGSAHISYWDITSSGTANTWKQDTLTLGSPSSNNGTNASLSNITAIGFTGLDASATYIIDTVKGICGMSVAVEGTQPGAYYKNIYLGMQPLETVIQSSPQITAPTTNPRIDILTIDSAGTLAWITGTQAATPVAPWSSLTAQKIPICTVYCKTTMSAVLDFEDRASNASQGYILSDVRPFLGMGISNLTNLINTTAFEISSGLLRLKDGGVETEKLEGGSATPGNDKYYGTNSGGTPGFYSNSLIPPGGIILWSGSVASIPSGWALCNGSNGTPNLQDRFIVGAGSTYAVAATGGATTHVHAGGSHTHTVSGTTTIGGDCFPGTRTSSTNGGVQLSDGKLAPQTFSVTSGASGTADTGSGSSLPPYYALAYIMKL